jgi:Zn-dependent protease
MSAEPPSSSFDDDIPEASVPTTVSAPAHPPQAGRFYRVDSSRTSYAELWRDSRSPLVLVAWVSKLLRLKLPGTVNDPNVVSLWHFVVADDAVEETVPSDVRQKFEPVVRELTDLGFGQAVYYSIHDRFHHSWTCQVALLHRDGRSVARVTHRVEGVQMSRTHFFTEFLSALTSGTFIHSSSARSQLLVPTQCQLNWDPKATTSQLWVSHRKQVEEAGQSGDRAVTMNGRDEMVGVLESHHEAVRDFQLERGVFSSMRGEDLAQVEALDKSVEQSLSGQVRHPEVMAQLERLQKKHTNWTSAILVLVVSIGLFIGAGVGAWKWSWEMLLMIVGILLVHEAGHYLAMKVFNYRNVRMFFIPFLGAAVSGQSYTAPGWKKVVVSLMGPLPGIFLGGVLGIVGIVKGNDLLMQVALMAVILNGFQLLPVLPLDGGRIMHTLLFSRHYYLDTVFHVLAAGALAGIGAVSGDKILLYLGLFMLIGAPVAYKVARIAMELRRQGFGPDGLAAAAEPQGVGGELLATPIGGPAETVARTMAMPGVPPVPFAAPLPDPWAAEQETIPEPVADAIIEQTQTRFPRVKTSKQIAELTLRVYETLATRPPGIAASLGFAFVHGAAFVVALVLLVMLVIPQSDDLMELLAASAVNPTRSIEPDQIRTWYAPSTTRTDAGQAQPATSPTSTPAPGAHETIIATFSTAEAARTAFDDVQPRAPASASLVCFGQSVLLSLPAADETVRTEWLAEFESRAEDVFVDAGGNFGATLTFTCRASISAEVKETEKQLSEFLSIPAALYLIPPWADDELDQRSDEERTRHQAARAIYCKLQEVWIYEAPELDALRDDMARAARRNNQAEYERLSTQLIDVQHELTIRELERIRDEDTDPSARDLADRYIAVKMEEHEAEAIPGDPAEATEFEPDPNQLLRQIQARRRDELGPLMGQLLLPPDGSRPTPRVLRYSPRWGYVRQAAAGKIVVNVSFEDVSYGAPALLSWLRQRGYGDFKYEFSSYGGF